MRVLLRVLTGLTVVCVLSANVRSADVSSPEEGASYQGLQPGAFMKQWLTCGPFPVFDGEEKPEDRVAQRQAFDRDFLTEHGGEANIRPVPGMVHRKGGKEYRWQRLENQVNLVNLIALYGRKEYVIAYAWAEIAMDEARSCLLGIASDDAVKVWLNGELVHENWTARAARPDDDLVAANFRAGNNQLLIKVQNGGGLWAFASRLVDPNSLGGRLLPAVKSGDLTTARLCLSYGVDVNETDEHGFTALHLARMRGHEELVQLLLEQGADPNVEMPVAGTPMGFLGILWDSLKENYPMMEYAGAFDDSWYESCKGQIKDITGLYQALPIMDAMLVRRLNDYHTSLHWEGKPSLITPPVRLGLIEDQIVVTECPGDLGTACGDIVLEVEGVNARQRFDGELPRAFGATKYAKTQSACRAILEGEPGSHVKLKLHNRRGEAYEVVLKRGGYGSAGGPGSVLSSRVVDEDVGYIKIRGWGGFSPDEFDETLEPLREKRGLILDVRDNGGGSDRLAEQVIGRFITEKVVCSISFQRQAGTNTYEKITHLAEPRGPWCYEGKVAVLTNAACASACEHFVSGMFEAGALLVGTPTTGACGWSKGIDLPGGVTLRCALTFPLHGKVPSPLNGMEPHHLVTPTIEDIRTGRDTVLEEAVTLLNP